MWRSISKSVNIVDNLTVVARKNLIRSLYVKWPRLSDNIFNAPVLKPVAISVYPRVLKFGARINKACTRSALFKVSIVNGVGMLGSVGNSQPTFFIGIHPATSIF